MVEKIKKITLEIETCSKWRSSTDDPIVLYVGGHEWNLDNLKIDEFEKGQKDVFELDIPDDLTPSDFRYLCIKKDVAAALDDSWCIKAIKLTINDKVVYEKDNINFWLKDNIKSWCAPGFSYGQAGK